MLTVPRGASLAVLAEAAEARFGTQTMLAFEGTDHTTAALGAWARRFASGLLDLGVRPGDRVAVCMANCPEVLVAYQAIWRVGAAVTPLLFLLSVDELRHAVLDAGAVVIVTTPEFLPKVLAATAGTPVRTVVTGADVDGATGLDGLAAGDEAALVRRDPADMAALLYTGGTTGRSKGVVLAHDALSSAAWTAVAAGADDHFSVSLLPLPLAHAFGLLVSTMGLHAVEPSRQVLMRWFDPDGWLRLVAAERVQVGSVVPTMLRLIATRPVEDHDLSSLRRLVCGSAPLPADVAAQWAARVPGCEVAEGYGCSETAAMGSSSPTGEVRAGSVGRAAIECELRVVDLAGHDARPGVDGEVLIRTPALMTGYWHDPEATAAAIGDGWFHTGDLGHLDDDGYLFLVDRLKDVIIRGGFNVYPRDVEDALTAHPDVAVCAVVGRPDPEHGEEVIAFVQLVPGATVSPDDLVAYAREHLSAVKYPREIHVIDPLPLTSIGKLDRKALRARIALR